MAATGIGKMTALKIMNTKHYKPGAVISTASVKYGNRMAKDKPTLDLIRAIIDHTKQFSLTIKDVLYMCLDFQTGQFPPRVPEALPGAIARDLIGQSKASSPIHEGKFSATFWEELYEDVRATDRPHCPSRLDSYFAFKDIDSLRSYQKLHWADRMQGKTVCQIDTQKCTVSFEADTSILDDVSEVMTYEAARKEILRYWDQETAGQPLIELVLQGSIVLGNRI